MWTAMELNPGFPMENLVALCLSYSTAVLISSLLQMLQLVLSSLDM